MSVEILQGLENVRPTWRNCCISCAVTATHERRRGRVARGKGPFIVDVLEEIPYARLSLCTPIPDHGVLAEKARGTIAATEI
jgi:hypothetical protein